MKKSRMIYDRGVAFFFGMLLWKMKTLRIAPSTFLRMRTRSSGRAKKKQQICLQPAVNERNAETGAIFQRAGKILL